MRIKKVNEMNDQKGKLTDKEWVTLVKKMVDYTHKDLRIGQSWMNALYDIKPELYKDISGTNNDPFYIDENIHNFLTYLND